MEEYLVKQSDYIKLEKECYELKECNVELMQEIDMLKKQLDYLRSGEYYNQLRFERDMLQDLVDKGEISKEDKKFIDCTHRNTELLEELEKKEFLLISQGKELKELYKESEQLLDNWNKLKEWLDNFYNRL